MAAQLDLRLRRLLLDRDGVAGGVEFDDAVTLRLIDAIGEHRGAAARRIGPPQRFGRGRGRKEVVAEDQARRRAGEKIARR